ncbi:Poly(ADP-ribose) polymerase PARP [Carpediemonas membranifera]|uniref:Poly [ADP-ribose] polymerase n=1 Tax=Carpediemonas membranifera TaxID=201153 RepID=A0A8J6B5G9_9EUKA|nr:Poly(ADP-ribose) polymerase PARP [Carpediemonas membranifera]|eukprot:KAG9393272.1 Poly(ADP-ribose) polymerase PARP [Carpediemonas membranifera]
MPGRLPVYLKGRFSKSQAVIGGQIESLNGDAIRLTKAMEENTEFEPDDVILFPKKEDAPDVYASCNLKDEAWLQECLKAGKWIDVVIPPTDDEASESESDEPEEPEEAEDEYESEIEDVPAPKKPARRAAPAPKPAPKVPSAATLTTQVAATGGAEPTEADFMPEALTPDPQAMAVMPAGSRIVVHEGVLYKMKLNQTDIKTNANKYYNLELARSPAGTYHIFFIWGRVGKIAGRTDTSFANLDDAINVFAKKFKDKAKLNWPDERFGESGRAQTYVPLHFEWSDPISAAKKRKAAAVAEPSKRANVVKAECTLPVPVRKLLELISNRSHIEHSVRDLDLDLTRMPLGRLSEDHILKAYDCLKSAQGAIKLGDRNDVIAQTNRFYTLFPVQTYGIDRPPILDEMLIKKYAASLDALYDIRRTLDLLDAEEEEEEAAEAEGERVHHLDALYKKLDVPLGVVPHDDPRFNAIEQFLTVGPTHQHMLRNPVVSEVFTVNPTEGTSTTKRMLWHGSRASNYVGILGQGLRIAPPEAPVTGYMFGKGIYLADVMTKSYGYCHPQQSEGKALLMLCEADMGTMKQHFQSNSSLHDIKVRGAGIDSTHGVGKWQFPVPGKRVDLDGFKLPLGPLVEKQQPGLNLQYNEFIVYETARVNIRYLVVVEEGKR